MTASSNFLSSTFDILFVLDSTPKKVTNSFLTSLKSKRELASLVLFARSCSSLLKPSISGVAWPGFDPRVGNNLSLCWISFSCPLFIY